MSAVTIVKNSRPENRAIHYKQPSFQSLSNQACFRAMNGKRYFRAFEDFRAFAVATS